MDPTLLGLVFDTSSIITAERANITAPDLFRAVRRQYGEVDLSLSPIVVSELVHGIYRARDEQRKIRRQRFVKTLLDLCPVHPIDARTGWLAGQIQGEQAARGNIIPFDDLLIACAALEQDYAVLTANVRHFGKIPKLTVLTFTLDL